MKNLFASCSTMLFALMLASGCAHTHQGTEEAENRAHESGSHASPQEEGSPCPHKSGTGNTTGAGKKKHATQGHGPAPIDCPMRQAEHPHKQGHGHQGGNHPFASMDEYISHLERADRSSWQKPDEVIAALGLNGEEVVADMGAGSGYFSVPLAKSVPSGRVYGADPEIEMVQFMEKRVGKEGIANLKPLQVDSAAPVLPEAVDLLFICDVLHHVETPVQWLKHLQQFLKPNGALALIEFRMGELPLGPPESMRIPRTRLVEMATESGYVLEREIEGILPYQVFLLFKPAESRQNPEGP